MASRVSKEARVARAKEIIAAHPSYGKTHINKVLRQEYGTGLRRKTVGQLKHEVLYAHPTRVEKRYQTLIRDHFLPSEARQYSQYPISSPAMRKFRSQRRRIVRQGEKWGMTRKAINNQIRADYRIDGFYTKGKIQPVKAYLAFLSSLTLPTPPLKAPPMAPPEYHPEALPGGITQYQRQVYNQLTGSGFLPFESWELILGKGLKAPMSDTHLRNAMRSAEWIRAMDERSNWIKLLRSRKWSDQLIMQRIWGMYRADPSRTPWDFIREYIYLKRKVADFGEAARRRSERSRSRVKKMYGSKVLSRMGV